jgi:hypothetical protein
MPSTEGGKEESSMSSQIRVTARILGAIFLVGLALFCAFGFLASFELGSLNVFHIIYGVAAVAALLGGVCLFFSALESMSTDNADPQWVSYCQPLRLASLLSLFSVLAFMKGFFAHLWFLLFLLFLLPIPAKPRAKQ